MTYQAFPRYRATLARDDDARFGSPESGFACNLRLPDPTIFAWLSGGAIALCLALAAAVAAAAELGLIAVEGGLMSAFWVEAERNVPTFVNFALLVFAFSLLALIALRSWSEASAWRWHWMTLSAAFLFLSFDEAARMHEMLGSVGGRIVSADGVFRFAWVAVALPLVAVFALGFVRFLLALPRRPAALILISGAAYVGGALGLEMVNAALFDAAGGHRNAAYAFFTLLEEGLEMSAMTLFSFALLTYLGMPSHQR